MPGRISRNPRLARGANSLLRGLPQAKRPRLAAAQCSSSTQRPPRPTGRRAQLAHALRNCHRLAELERIPHPDGGYWPVLTLAICLSLKLESDPENWDLAWLEEHHRIGKLPSRLPLPTAFQIERSKYASRVVGRLRYAAMRNTIRRRRRWSTWLSWIEVKVGPLFRKHL